MCVGYENECTGCCECNPKPKGHPHAELMMQYAEDAKVHEHPWELWEHRVYSVINYRNWEKITSSPVWSNRMEYRRKPRTLNINGYEVPEPVRIPDSTCIKGDNWVVDLVDGRAVQVDSLNSVGSSLKKVMSMYRDGLVHSTLEAAELHAKALLSFTRK